MFSAEEIIELEQKWFKYKVKQKSKLYLVIILILLLTSVLVLYFIPQYLVNTKETVPVVKNIKEKQIVEIKKLDNKVVEINITSPIEINSTKNIEFIEKKIEKNEKNKFAFKLIPTVQSSELFSSSGSLKLNIFGKKDIIDDTTTSIEYVSKKPTFIQEIPIKKEVKKASITINEQEIDTIKYLKEKFYSTSNIIFTLMLAEEYYNKKEYEESIKWALTANDINSKNDKSWYWFAKSKIKLDKKEDALRALKAYLLNNKSNRLQTLLNKIELGDIHDN